VIRTRMEIVYDLPGEACTSLSEEILRQFLSAQLEVLLDIRDLLQPETVTVNEQPVEIDFVSRFDHEK